MKKFSKEILEEHPSVNYQIGDLVKWRYDSADMNEDGERLMDINVYRGLFNGGMAGHDTDEESFLCRGPFLVLGYEFVRKMLIIKVWSMKRQRVGYRVADLFTKCDP